MTTETQYTAADFARVASILLTAEDETVEFTMDPGEFAKIIREAVRIAQRVMTEGAKGPIVQAMKDHFAAAVIRPGKPGVTMPADHVWLGYEAAIQAALTREETANG